MEKIEWKKIWLTNGYFNGHWYRYGSGIFIKGGKILSLTNGNMLQAIAVVLLSV